MAVTDNAANMLAAVKVCKWGHVPCFAYTINLTIVAEVKAIFPYFKRSSSAMYLPEVKIEQNSSSSSSSCTLVFDAHVKTCA